jgi:uncharacterized membrane protein
MWTICNHSEDVWTAILWLNTDACGGESGDWMTRGWYRIAPESCANVLDEDLDEINRYFYYYADNGNGVVWAGNYSLALPENAFERCIGVKGGDDIARGFREVDVGDGDNLILNLDG